MELDDALLFLSRELHDFRMSRVSNIALRVPRTLNSAAEDR
jgi:hypothetical protein